jgi:protein ImuB
MLWLSLYLPQLALDLIAPPGGPEEPLVISVREAGRRRVFAANCAASRLGIAAGMELGAAQALAQPLHAHPRHPQREVSALERIATWSGQFTSHVSPVPSQGVLLEIEGSLTLFGGLQALMDELRTGLTTLGYRARFGVAPTPQGAWWAARAGLREPILHPSDLSARLAPIALARLDLAPEQLATLRSLGMHTLSDCLRLPRAGLAQRIGTGLLAELDRALGRSPDPRPAFIPPERFHSRIPLANEMDRCEDLLLVARRLLWELVGFLRARDAAVQQWALELVHRNGGITPLAIGQARPDRDLAHFLDLTREHLARLQLPRPVLELGLRAEELLPYAPAWGTLFHACGGRSPPTPWPHLVARLQARLGAGRVHGLCVLDEHRPEQAWAYCQPGEQAQPRPPGPTRPCWLLEKPRMLRTVTARPWLDGPLTLARGPERIEAGWWDGRDIRRDYFVAESPRGSRLWVFRELSRDGGWFLHGIFA